MKIIKKSMCFFLVFIMLTGSSYAQSNSKIENLDGANAVKETVYYEYDMLKEMISSSDQELSKKGYSNSQIKEIRLINLDELVYQGARKKNQNSMLKFNATLKKSTVATFSEDMKRDSMGAMRLDHCITSHYYDKSDDKTHAQINFNWEWVKSPIYRGTDMIAFGWDTNMYVDNSSSFSSYHRVFYASCKTDRITNNHPANHEFEQYEPNCVAAEFSEDMCFGAEYAIKGDGHIKLYCGGKEKNIGASFKYGHNYLGLSGPTLSAPWGIAFTIKGSVTTYQDKLENSQL